MEPSVTDLGSAMIEGSLEGLTPANEDDVPGIVIGKDLAAEIGAKVGDTVRVLTHQRHAVADGRDAAPAALQGHRHFPDGLLRGRCRLRLCRSRRAACCSPAPTSSSTSS